MKLFVNEYEEKLNLLCEKCKEMKQIYNKVLVSKIDLKFVILDRTTKLPVKCWPLIRYNLIDPIFK